mmetsp:Transcript_38197/g.73472  ORF Transcript_38197/g.73472 Transcript_38197/m.73472 type:complete len:82 (+) Transcript_38197:1015-1260(+)
MASTRRHRWRAWVPTEKNERTQEFRMWPQDWTGGLLTVALGREKQQRSRLWNIINSRTSHRCICANKYVVVVNNRHRARSL